MPEGSTAEIRAGLSTTLLLSVAAVAVALVAIFGEDGAFTPLTVTCALLGLVPWALVAGGVRVPSWLFLALAVPPGVVIVAVADNPGGMFPLMLAIVWLTRTSLLLVVPAVAVALAFLAILDCTFQKGSADDSGIVYFVGGLGISWLSGLLLRRQEALTAQLEAMRDAQVERMAATERARIARDVHDVVAHSLTVVMLNLTGARRALATDPAGADEALQRAETVGRESLDSIRQVMGLLREPAADAALPQPTIDALPRLVDGYRRAGLDVELAMPHTTAVDPAVGLVAYRVVQESLANVLQHAPGAPRDRGADRPGSGHPAHDRQRPGDRDVAGPERADRSRHAGDARAGAGRRWHVPGRRHAVRRLGGVGVAPGALPWPRPWSGMPEPLSVVLVDDQPLVRAGIAFILSTEPGIEVVSEAGNGELGLVAVADHRPDVVLMDVRMPVMDGLEATRRIRAGDGPPVLVLTTFDDDDVLWGAVEAGAAGFLLKDAPADEIIRAIRTVADGGSWLDPRVTPRLLDALRSARPTHVAPAVLAALSEREVEVLALIARGMSNVEIAAALYVSERTVKGHVGSIFTKLGARDRAAAIVLAYDAGLVTPGAQA